MVSDTAGFTTDFVSKMKKRLLDQIDVQNVGAVVAAPDKATPGGSYYYHWVRDGGLTMDAYMDIEDNDYDTVKDKMTAYEGWVRNVHKLTPIHDNLDVRIEVKFEIPSGAIYAGGWCRPQTDGPPIRARAMLKWANLLWDQGLQDRAKNDVWPLIQQDLDWVIKNWNENSLNPHGCDLWEEVRSDNFFWNRMAFVTALHNAAEFATKTGVSTPDQYTSAASAVEDTVKQHWNGVYLIASSGRPKDGSTTHAIATLGEYQFGPTSAEAAQTISVLNDAFCEEYPINNKDSEAGTPGILYGRYPGDHYAGGNPWQLLSVVLGELYYKVSIGYGKLGDEVPDCEHSMAWKKLLKLEDGASGAALANTAFKAGDAVMYRVWQHVKNDDGRIDEQIDKNTGAQASAKSLTWSLANVLHALKVRDQASVARNQTGNLYFAPEGRVQTE